jgi:hypothetical protein
VARNWGLVLVLLLLSVLIAGALALPLASGWKPKRFRTPPPT